METIIKFRNSAELKEAIQNSSCPEEIFRALRGGLIPSEGESECLINKAVNKYLERLQVNIENAVETYIRSQEAMKYLVTQRTKYFSDEYEKACDSYQKLLYFLTSFIGEFPDEVKGKLLKIKALYTYQEICQMVKTPFGLTLTGIKREAKSKRWFPFVAFGGKEIIADHYISSPELSARNHQLKVSSLYNEDTQSFWGLEVSWRLRNDRVYLWELQYCYEWRFSLVRESNYYDIEIEKEEKRQGDLIFSIVTSNRFSQEAQLMEETPPLLDNHKFDAKIEEIFVSKRDKNNKIYWVKFDPSLTSVKVCHPTHPTIVLRLNKDNYVKVREVSGHTHYTPRYAHD